MPTQSKSPAQVRREDEEWDAEQDARWLTDSQEHGFMRLLAKRDAAIIHALSWNPIDPWDGSRNSELSRHSLTQATRAVKRATMEAV